MKLEDIDVIVQRVGLDRHVRKRLIIVFHNRANEMAHVLIKFMAFNVDVHHRIQAKFVNMISMNVWPIHV